MRAPTEPQSAGDRDNNFDFLRFALAALVVFAHAFYVLGHRGVHVGMLAVLGFFGISGFLVTQSWMRRRSLFDYALKRVLRIYPGFTVAVLFDYLVVAPIGTGLGLAYVAGLDPIDVVRDVVLLDHLGIPGVFRHLPNKATNGSLWSIPYEFLCYTALAVVGTVGLLRQRAVGAIVAALWLAQFAFPPGLFRRGADGATVALVLPFATAFAVGALLRLRGPRVEATAGRIAALVGLLAVSLVHRRLVLLVWPLVLPFVLIWLAHHPRLPFRGFGKRGDFSYGLYLFHFPIQQLLVHATDARIGPLPLFVASMALAFPVAVVSWYGIERPFLRLKERRRSEEGPGARMAA